MGKLPLILLVLFLFNRCRAFSFSFTSSSGDGQLSILVIFAMAIAFTTLYSCCVFYCTRVDSDDVELPPAKVARVHPAQPHQGRQSSSRHRPGPKSVTSPQNEEEDPRLNRAGASASHQWIQESQGQHVDAAYYHNQQDQRHPVPYHSRHGYQDAVI